MKHIFYLYVPSVVILQGMHIRRNITFSSSELPKTPLSYKLKPSMPLLKIVTGKAEARLSFLQGFINQERFS